MEGSVTLCHFKFLKVAVQSRGLDIWNPVLREHHGMFFRIEIEHNPRMVREGLPLVEMNSIASISRDRRNARPTKTTTNRVIRNVTIVTRMVVIIFRRRQTISHVAHVCQDSWCTCVVWVGPSVDRRGRQDQSVIFFINQAQSANTGEVDKIIVNTVLVSQICVRSGTAKLAHGGVCQRSPVFTFDHTSPSIESPYC